MRSRACVFVSVCAFLSRFMVFSPYTKIHSPKEQQQEKIRRQQETRKRCQRPKTRIHYCNRIHREEKEEQQREKKKESYTLVKKRREQEHIKPHYQALQLWSTYFCACTSNQYEIYVSHVLWRAHHFVVAAVVFFFFVLTCLPLFHTRICTRSGRRHCLVSCRSCFTWVSCSPNEFSVHQVQMFFCVIHAYIIC